MPSKGGKVFNVSSKESKETIVLSYLLYITYQGTFQQSYNEGEVFNPDGLQIVAHFSDGSTRILTNTDSVEWKYFPTVALDSTTTYITAYYSYYEKTASCKIPITVTKTYVESPYILEESFKYNAQEQTPTIMNYDSRYMTMEGALQATNAGTYKITFKIIDPKYQFTTGGQELVLQWTIEKAVRPLTLSQDTYNFEEGYTLGTPIPIYLNYPGNTGYRHLNVGGTSSYFQFQYDNSTINNTKMFNLTVWNMSVNARQVVEFWIEGDDNYLESEHVQFTAVISFWEWGDETGANNDYMDDDWIQGMADYIAVRGTNKAWVGKRKVMKLAAPAFNYTYSGSTIPMICIGVDKDAPNSISLIADSAGYEKQQFNQSEDSEWPRKTEDISQPEYMLNCQDYIIENPYVLANVLPGKKYLIPMKKQYWTGEETKVHECIAAIPSAAELGITSDLAPTYIGGQNNEYTEGVHSPYEYFIDNERRIRREYDTNEPVVYWTRSTSDDGDKADGTNINVNQIVVNADGTTSTLNKTTPLSDSSCAYPVFIVCYGLGGEETYNV